MLDQAALPWFAELNRGLGDTLDDRSFDERLRRNTALLHQLAAEICERARPRAAADAVAALESLLAGTDRAARQPLLFQPAA
jgi:hypothetical protein